MTKKISGAEYPLSKIFSSDFEYVIPSYQRPYAWTVDEASELFDDLYSFYSSEKEDSYFLGSIVLIKQENQPYSEVIDGQQRLTTLTILLAALASQAVGKYRDEVHEYIMEPGHETEGREPKPRLTLRERDKDFFSRYVQSLDFEGLLKLDAQTLGNESQHNIQGNSAYFITQIKQKFGDDVKALKGFISFIMLRCFIVAVSTPNQQSAFRVFSVMNSRGLDLQPTDILKADIIGKIESEKERDDYNERWEDMEVRLGRSGFNDLFNYIRMVYAKEKAKTALLEEFKAHVLSKHPSSKQLIESVLEPYADALAIIKSAKYEASANAQDVNILIKWLLRIDNSDWMPVAMQFLAKQKHNPEYVLWFFQRLERLAAYMHVCARGINERIDRYNQVVSGLEKENSLENPVGAVELTPEERASMKAALNGDIYELTPRRRNYIILRLDSFLSDGAASYDSSLLTIEHVLPQTVNPETEWATLWPEPESRQSWVHKIANLVPLNCKRNSQAQNYDFGRKKEAYFKGDKGVSSYALTTQVLNTPAWTPAYLEQRQSDLLKIMSENWKLDEAA